MGGGGGGSLEDGKFGSCKARKAEGVWGIGGGFDLNS